MKFWIVFIVLKAVEIIGIIFAPHFLGKIICKKFPNIRYDNIPPYWVVGLMAVLVIFTVLLIGTLFVILNIELTNYLMREALDV